jgi:hypothetical protein
MIGFAESIVAWVIATTVPALAGLMLIVSAGRLVKPNLLTAFALGIFLWFFVDTIEGSGDLGVNYGFGGGLPQVTIVLLFAAGAFAIFGLDRSAFSQDVVGPDVGFTVAVLVSLAIGVHGLGEGAAFGVTASATPKTNLIEAFGGYSAGLSYVLHKALEPMIAGACYLAYSRGPAKSTTERTKDTLVLTLVFVLPSMVGALTGYFIAYDVSYYFALGTGTSIYAAIRLAKTQSAEVRTVEDAGFHLWNLRMVLALVLGFIFIYLAALLHS